MNRAKVVSDILTVMGITMDRGLEHNTLELNTCLLEIEKPNPNIRYIIRCLECAERAINNLSALDIIAQYQMNQYDINMN